MSPVIYLEPSMILTGITVFLTSFRSGLFIRFTIIIIYRSN